MYWIIAFPKRYGPGNFGVNVINSTLPYLSSSLPKYCTKGRPLIDTCPDPSLTQTSAIALLR
jgi:hypothetical protein